MRRASAFLVVALLGAGCTGAHDAARVAGKVEQPATQEAAGTAPSSTGTSLSTTTTARPPSTTGAPGVSSPTTSTTAPPSAPSTTAPAPARAVSPSTTTPVPVPTPTTSRSGGLADVKVRLTRVAMLDQPLALAQRAGDDALYVAEKSGRVRAVRGGSVQDDPVLDLSSEIKTGGEQGLLGIAFSPDGNFLYASFTERTNGDSRLLEYAFRDGKADVSTERELLYVTQPYANHNGGQVTFGPDGLLYFGLGDGGSGNDPHDNAQNLNTLLGKMLRIDPRKPADGKEYGIPPDNPFAGRTDARGEIWEYGLRNPWRWSFDRQTGDFWIGDVGQNMVEEIDYRPKDAASGANFGWPSFEGRRRNPVKASQPDPDNAVPPVYDYPTQQGCAVTGGYVYRGSRIPALRGTYVFGDFCNGMVQGLRLEGGKVAEHRDLGPVVGQLASFGEDREGELYALSLTEGLFRIDPA